MANLVIQDGASATKYLKASGAGTDGDPFVTEQAVTESNSAAALTQLQAIVAALGGTLTVDAGTVTVTGPLTNAQLRASAILTLMAELPDTAEGDLAAIAAALEGTLTVDQTAVTTALGSLLTELQGKADPTEAQTVNQADVVYTTTMDSYSTSGDHTHIAAPGTGQRLVIYGLMVQAEADGPVTVLIKDGSLAKRSVKLVADGDGAAWQWPAGREWRLTMEQALVINTSDTTSVRVTVDWGSEIA